MSDVQQRNSRVDQHSWNSPNGINQQHAMKANGTAPVMASAVIENSHPTRSSKFTGQNVVILGLARQGIALARYLCRQGAHVTISDLATEDRLHNEIADIKNLPVGLVLGGHPDSLLEECDLLFLSGGVPPQIPLVHEAIERGIPLSNDGLLTLELAQAYSLGPVVGITGSSGKTTTTTLVGLMLAEDDRIAHVGGNIGLPLVDRMDGIQRDEPVVLELSSFQLELFDTALVGKPIAQIGPQVAAIINITPNHLDRHPSMTAYVAAKLNLIGTMPPGSRLILNLDDTVTAALSSQYAESSSAGVLQEWELEDVLAEALAQIQERKIETVPYSLDMRLEKGACLNGETLMLNGEAICDRHELQLRGEHNVSNILAAAAISHAAGASTDSIRRVAREFRGVPHRLEIVEGSNDVIWINDSIATAPERAVAALRSFENPAQTIILLAGGKDKNLPWQTFAKEVIERVHYLIGFGESGAMIVNQVKEQARFSQQQPPGCATVQRLDEAVSLAARIAAPQSVVLLSPGGASFDTYKDFEERGEHFRQLVHQALENRGAVSELIEDDVGDTRSAE